MFSDHMVLPREKDFLIRGTADAREKVKVTVDGDVLEAVANNRGQWCVLVPHRPAKVGAELRIETAKSSLVYRDVAFGDIWLCSGQSNMGWCTGTSLSATSGCAPASPTWSSRSGRVPTPRRARMPAFACMI